MLMSKARIHSHDQHLVEIWENFFQDRRRSSRVYCHSNASSKRLNALHRTVESVWYFPKEQKWGWSRPQQTRLGNDPDRRSSSASREAAAWLDGVTAQSA